MKKSDWLIWVNGFGYIQIECQNCHYRLIYDEAIPNHCPNCGAEMDKEVSNDQKRGFRDHV